VIRRLRISDWKVQNQAVKELADLLANATSAQLKQIGLALASAANSSAVEPLEFVQSILENQELSKETRGAVLVGVLAEVFRRSYFSASLYGVCARHHSNLSSALWGHRFS